ncbi:carbonic anhydrase [Parerythrobacter jejuensis]|uniref:carbonic anhydrase n=1 Tax=Parerythrobacter jejuensis TaxID=795812 RepID=A0A845AUP4_9SPHN|nr:carbonic anhydrase family protein [Parerythrobacter jejuensis]MXP32226.1 carbonic anhydrase family protein [Parerythrobacter jejuensis]
MKTLAFLAVASLAATPALAQKDWNFGDGTTPERWSTVNSAYALCDAGLTQSPIDLGNANAIGNVKVSTNYGQTTGAIALGDEKVQVDFQPGMGMTSGDKAFGLVQVHFHTPAEHAINGERHPLVGHFVHATEGGELGVLGIMFEEGEANGALQSVIDAAGSGNGTAVSFDVNDMLPDDVSVFRYMGSLTTPPCSEGVNWHVSKSTMTASAEQIAALYELLGDSARTVQPLGGRLLVAPE